jgi:hypothetical protein
MDPDDKDFAREALRRSTARPALSNGSASGELERCARAAVQAAVADAFERPGSLRVKSGGPCEVCRKRRSCIGTPRSDP